MGIILVKLQMKWNGGGDKNTQLIKAFNKFLPVAETLKIGQNIETGTEGNSLLACRDSELS